MLLTTTPEGMAAFMGAIKTYVAAAPGVKVHLFQNDFAPAPESQISDFVEADFVGYIASPIGAWGGPFRTSSGNFRIGANCSWAASDDTKPNTIFGYYAIDGTSTLLVCARFAKPVQMVDEFSAITFNFVIEMPQNALVSTQEPT